MAMAPRRLAAKIAWRNSGQLYESRPTASPGRTPRSCNPPASAMARAAIAAYVVSRPSKTVMARPGERAAWWASTENQLTSALMSPL